MSEKSYLKNQIKLVSLNANDLFTDQEYEIFMEICELMNEIDKMDADPNADKVQLKALIAKKKAKSKLLTQTVKKHAGVPRKVRLASVLAQNKNASLPLGATWKRLKYTKMITEFESEMSRAMGLHPSEYTFDKIIIKWKTEDIFEQLVLDGFTFDLLQKDGTVVQKRYRCFTASAGQLRRDKCQFVSEEMWQKIKPRLECGLDWDALNSKGGINVN